MNIQYLTQYFIQYGAFFIYLIVLLEYLKLLGFPAGVIMSISGIWASQGEKEYTISGNTLSDSIYQTGVDTNVADLMYNAAKEAKALIDLAEDEDTFAQAGKACVQNAITSTTQYIYKFGCEVGIY